MPFTTSHGVDIHYTRHSTQQPGSTPTNAKPSVVMVAGMASDSASWTPIVEGLSAKQELICIDNRCTGRSQHKDIESSRSLNVDDVIAVMDACELEKVNLVGHSMGTMISWALASRAPERVNAMVAMSAPMFVDHARIDLFNTLARLRSEANEKDWFRLLFQFLFSRDFFNNSGNVEAAVLGAVGYEYKQSLQAFTQQCKALPSFLEPPVLPHHLQFPVLALTGNNDKMFSPTQMRESYEGYAPIEFVTIDNAAHSVHWENPDAVTQTINEFFDKA